MDRGERRRRDENYVKWMIARYFAVMNERPSDLPKGDRFLVRYLGLKKTSAWACHHCSKKRPGKPKLPRGVCGLGMDRSPKKGRGRWRLDIELTY
jgi:hypothetical protein